MKHKTCTLLIAAALCVALAAPAEAARPIIKSDTSYFDFVRGLYVLKGNVAVETNNRLITAGEARVNLVSLEVWGTGGITLTQDDIRFSGDSVYVDGTRQKAAISGGVTFRRGTLAITADEADYDWRSKQGIFRNNVRIDDNGEITTAGRGAYSIATNTYRTE